MKTVSSLSITGGPEGLESQGTFYYPSAIPCRFDFFTRALAVFTSFYHRGSCRKVDLGARICQTIVLFPIVLDDLPKSYFKKIKFRKTTLNMSRLLEQMTQQRDFFFFFVLLQASFFIYLYQHLFFCCNTLFPPKSYKGSKGLRGPINYGRINVCS